MVFFRHVPQAGVGREVAVVVTERLQAGAQQFEMLGLFGSDADPVGVIGLRQAAKAGGVVKSQIDRRKLDVHDGVE